MTNECNEKIVQGILCDAKNCVYHTCDDHCKAGEIQVGYHSSCNSSETACTTFKTKN